VSSSNSVQFDHATLNSIQENPLENGPEKFDASSITFAEIWYAGALLI